MLQESTLNLDTQLSFATTGPILHNEPFSSQVPEVKISLCLLFIIGLYVNISVTIKIYMSIFKNLINDSGINSYS